MAIRPYEDWLGIPASVERPNHYELLGLIPGAVDESLLKASYEHRYALVRCYEVGNYCDEATRLLREIAVAYDVLRDSQRKQAYDTELERAAERATQHDLPSTRETVSESARPAKDAAPGMGQSPAAGRTGQTSAEKSSSSGQTAGATGSLADHPNISVDAKAGSVGRTAVIPSAAKPRGTKQVSGQTVVVKPNLSALGAGSAGTGARVASAAQANNAEQAGIVAPTGQPDPQPLALVKTADETKSTAAKPRNARNALLGGGAVALAALIGGLALALSGFDGGGEDLASTPTELTPLASPPMPSPVVDNPPTSASNSSSELQVALDQLSGELRKVIVVPTDAGDAIHLLLKPIQGDPVEAFVADQNFAEQLWDIPATVELGAGKPGPIVQVSGQLVEQQALTARFEEARRWIKIQRIQSPQGSAEVGKTRSTYSLPETHRAELHRLRKVDEHVEITAYLESEPKLGRTPPFETVMVVQDRHYLVEIPTGWRDAISGQDIAEPLALTAAITGRFANREGRELPLIRGLTLINSASPSPTAPADTFAANSGPSPSDAPPPGPTPVMPRTEPPPATRAESSSPAERLDGAVELPSLDSAMVQTLGELPWSASPEVQLALDSRCAALPDSTQMVIEANGPQRFRVLLSPTNQPVAAFAIQDNQLKFAWFKSVPAEAIQLRNCRLKISDGSESSILQLREPIFSSAFSTPAKKNATQVPLQVRDLPDLGKLVWEASVEFDGTPVDQRAIGQQLKFGAKRRFPFKDVSQFGELAEAIGVELRLGNTAGELIMIISPQYSRSPYNAELTEEGLQEGLEAVERSFAGAQQRLIEARRRYAEILSRTGVNPKVRAASLDSAQRAINSAQETMAKAVFYKQNVHPRLTDFAFRLQNSVKIRFRVTANVDDAVILLHDCEYPESMAGIRN